MDPIDASPTWRWFGYDNSMVIVDGINVQSVSGGGHLVVVYLLILKTTQGLDYFTRWDMGWRKTFII